MNFLVLNSGSSSQKTRLYEIGEAHGSNRRKKPEADRLRRKQWVLFPRTGCAGIVDHVMEWNARAIASRSEVDAVGPPHVQGGLHFRDPIIIADEVESGIARVSEFSPLHNPAGFATYLPPR